MNADPLAQLLASRDRDLIHVASPDLHMMLLAEEVAWLRAHRDELLAALGGTEHKTRLLTLTDAEAVDVGGHPQERVWRFESPLSVWVFGEDA